ncbi:MAG: hypothetical protein JSS49_12310 [Planctomycetes bacterium]|nr:hypothetical protein [Planctomycetota bacterium]
MNPPQSQSRLCLAAVELFVVMNLAFLALDVYIAHSTNTFEVSAEWIPVVFSLIAPPLLIVAMGLERSLCPRLGVPGMVLRERFARALGMLVGLGAIVVGIAGLLWHLNSHFFADATLKSLVYTAPFVAPLAYTGVGFLLLLDRMIPAENEDWGRWVVLLALGGFIGNFVLSLADHAQNGFFEWREWIPVVASAVAVGNLISVVFVDGSAKALKLSAMVMVLQIGVGVLGGYYHFVALQKSEMDSLWEKVVYSAPVFAPLLFANLAILALIGLWSISRNQKAAVTIPVSTTIPL